MGKIIQLKCHCNTVYLKKRSKFLRRFCTKHLRVFSFMNIKLVNDSDESQQKSFVFALLIFRKHKSAINNNNDIIISVNFV